MALIKENIPTQNFELVKNEIAFILKEEIDNQLFLLGEDIAVNVFLDRMIPVSDSENIVINIYLLKGKYNEITNVSSEGDYSYIIDIYTNSQSEKVISSSVLDMVYGWVRYILSHPEYKTLNFKRGVIAGTYVDSFESQSKLLIEDSNLFDIRSVVFNCRVYESQLGVDGDKINYNCTNFKICNSNKGYIVCNKLFANGDFNNDFNNDFLIIK